MQRNGQPSWKLALSVGLIALGVAGCSGARSKGHEVAVNAANERWQTLRSNTMLKLAQQQFDTGDLDQSEKTLVEAINADPKNARLYVLAGRIALERSQLERAFQRLATASTLDPKLSDAPYYQGIVLQRWQRYEEALACYEQSEKAQSDNPAFILAISEMLVMLDRMDEATARLKEKVGYFDQNAGIRVALAQLAMMKKNPAEAAEYLKQASRLQPDQQQIVENLAVAQLAANQVNEAIETLSKLCADPKNANRRDLSKSLAKAYVHAGRNDEAKRTFVSLTRSDATDVESWIELSELAWSEGDLGGALMAANRVINLAPRRQEGYVIAGLVWQKRGKIDEALRLFGRAAEVAPKDAEPELLRGMALQNAGRPADAAQAYAEALRRAPDDPRARELLATVSQTPEGH